MTLANDDILHYIDRLEKESKALETELIRLVWYMRGGISINDAYALSPENRERIADLVNKNLEVTKQSGLPFF